MKAFEPHNVECHSTLKWNATQSMLNGGPEVVENCHNLR